ncbi:diguanylate cyclase [Undibacterium sp. Jales W-56]|uniref:diguanylate cyclase n=1 Tax=Undibacterium sp. Jales W-56 TaxID=2897325 RepID=UPI0021CE74D9|nr:diguanylate cyclase [Undibacterium sp. Jales W-56]MCU6432560.1 diguanylate cyclase [Undibacterium sp. Jales W-56]
MATRDRQQEPATHNGMVNGSPSTVIATNGANPGNTDAAIALAPLPPRSWFGLREQLMMLVMGVAILCMLAAVATFFFVSQRSMEIAIESHLASVARLHAQRIDEFNHFLRAELQLMSNRTQLSKSVSAYIDHRSDGALEQANELLNDAKRSASFIDNVLIYGIDGKLITSVSAISQESQQLDVSTRDSLLTNPLITASIVGADGRRLIRAGGPLMDGRRVIGILVILTSMEPLRAISGSSAGWVSEELIITEIDANGAPRPITPLRFAMLEDVPVVKLTRIHEARSGTSEERHLLSGKDYRGTPVLAYTHNLAQPNWTIIVKIDQEDAYKPLRDQRNLWLALMLTVFVVTAAIAVWLSSHFTLPILHMAEVAVMIASGDLKRRMQHASRDELGMLSYSVNRMADKLLDVSSELEVQLRLQQDRAERLNEQLIHANNELHWLSRTDALTRLFNRRTLDETLESEWLRATRSKHSLAAIMIDIDFFKLINDISGHASGDECLRRVGALLKETAQRSGDFIARYGGEEFVVLVVDADLPHAMAFAERIKTRLAEEAIHHPASEIGPYVTVSMGIAALHPSKETSPQVLLSLADQALYLAKSRGRNRIETLSGH